MNKNCKFPSVATAFSDTMQVSSLFTLLDMLQYKQAYYQKLDAIWCVASSS